MYQGQKTCFATLIFFVARALSFGASTIQQMHEVAQENVIAFLLPTVFLGSFSENKNWVSAGRCGAIFFLFLLNLACIIGLKLELFSSEKRL